MKKKLKRRKKTAEIQCKTHNKWMFIKKSI